MRRRKAITTIGAASVSVLSGVALAGGNQLSKAPLQMGEVVTLTISALRALKESTPGCVYWVTEAGREGWFRFVPEDKTSSDNDGTVIVSKSGLRFIRFFDGPLNVQWFGARGDGKTDDAPALTKALRHAVASGDVVYIPRTTQFYSIASTVHVPMRAGQQLVLESNNAVVKSTANLTTKKTDNIWKLTGYDERLLLSIGVPIAGTRETSDIHTAFDNNGATTVSIRGLVLDGSNIPQVVSTLKNGAADWSVKFGVGLQISAENVTIEECRFQNIFGYGVRLYGPANATVRSNVFHEVGGRGNTPFLKVDMDAFGDGLHLSSVKANGQIVVSDCIFQGISTLPHRSRVAVTFEFGTKNYSAVVNNCSFTSYAKCIHVEEKAQSDLKIDNCLFRETNCAIANVINDDGRCIISNSKFILTDIDNHDFGGTLLCLNYLSTCALFFHNCEIHFKTTEASWQAMAGAKLFSGCTFYGYDKNHFFADANARFVNSWFNGFGGTYKTFYSYNGGNEYVVENCDFSGDDIHARNENVKLTFLNCRHHTAGMQLQGNYMQNLGGVFPNLNGECTEHVLKAETEEIGPSTCPSPLWQTVNRILAVVTESSQPFGRNLSNHQLITFAPDASGKWTGTPAIQKGKMKEFRVVLAPAHYRQYLSDQA